MTTPHIRQNPQMLQELARLRQRVSALEDANRQLQRENLSLRHQHQVPNTVPVQIDDSSEKVDLLEVLLEEAFAQNRMFRAVVRDLEETMDEMEVRQELMDARIKRQSAQLEEAHRELNRLRAQLASRRSPEAVAPSRTSRESSVARLRQRLIAQRTTPQNLQSVSPTRQTLH